MVESLLFKVNKASCILPAVFERDFSAHTLLFIMMFSDQLQLPTGHHHHMPNPSTPLSSSERCQGSSSFPTQRELKLIPQHLKAVIQGNRYEWVCVRWETCGYTDACYPSAFRSGHFSPTLSNYDQPSIHSVLSQSAAWRSCLFIPIQPHIICLRLNGSSGVW